MKNSKIRKTKESSNSILKGLSEALEFASGNNTIKLKTNEIIIPEIPNFNGFVVKKIRKNLKMTQNLFAQTLGVSVKTVEAWEANKNIPQGPAQRILFALYNNPESVKSFLYA